jgi:hypothetical protein
LCQTAATRYDLGITITEVSTPELSTLTLFFVAAAVLLITPGTAGNWLRGNLQFLRAQRYVAGMISAILNLKKW